jgi:hypothetical protein
MRFERHRICRPGAVPDDRFERIGEHQGSLACLPKVIQSISGSILRQHYVKHHFFDFLAFAVN